MKKVLFTLKEIREAYHKVHTDLLRRGNTALRAENEKLREALEPLANAVWAPTDYPYAQGLLPAHIEEAKKALHKETP